MRLHARLDTWARGMCLPTGVAQLGPDGGIPEWDDGLQDEAWGVGELFYQAVRAQVSHAVFRRY